jgi:hypothetical protein
MDQENDSPVSTEEPSTKDRGDEVGYRRPPVPSRFRKGVSGNPKGRPKGSLSMDAVYKRTLREKVVINENGKRKLVTKLEAALKQLVNKAASGDLRAIKYLADLARESEAKQNLSAGAPEAITEIDQEVINGILERFQPQEPNDRALPSDESKEEKQ